MNNFILKSDSYKFSHYLQYPPKTTEIFSYLESRGGRYNHTVFFGLQMLLKKYFLEPISKNNIEEAEQLITAHGLTFYRKGWEEILELGYLPLEIRAVPEGSVIPTHNVLMTVRNTDPRAYWLPSFVETLLLKVWYPTTVATQSWHIKQMIYDYLKKTSDKPDEDILFKLHDFGYRGVSSEESAEFGGAAHLVSFMGSDTIAGVWAANHYYHSSMAGFSIPAMEHSSVTSWGQANEKDAYENMLNHFAKPGALVACVSDSYDIYNAIDYIWGAQLRDKVIHSGATVVIRPDSGHPASVVLKCLQLLDNRFGSSRTANGNYKVLNHVKVIQGDGINEDSIREILETATRAGFSATNIAFGMGGALLQQVNRDTQKFAYKCSMATVDDEDRLVFKSPVTDPGKQSKSGRLDLDVRNGKYVTVQESESYNTAMRVVYRDGRLLADDTFDEIRARANQKESVGVE